MKGDFSELAGGTRRGFLYFMPEKMTSVRMKPLFLTGVFSSSKSPLLDRYGSQEISEVILNLTISGTQTKLNKKILTLFVVCLLWPFFMI